MLILALLAVISLPILFSSESKDGLKELEFPYLVSAPSMKRSNDLSLFLQREGYRDEAELLQKLVKDVNETTYEDTFLLDNSNCTNALRRRRRNGLPLIKGLDGGYLYASSTTILVDRAKIDDKGVNSKPPESEICVTFANIVENMSERPKVVELDTDVDEHYFKSIGNALSGQCEEFLPSIRETMILYLIKLQVVDLRFLEKIRNSGPQSDKLDFILGQLYLALSEDEKGVEYLTNLRDTNNRFVIQFFLADYYAEKLDFVKYRLSLDKADLLNPEEYELIFAISRDKDPYQCHTDFLKYKDVTLHAAMKSINDEKYVLERILELHQSITELNVDEAEFLSSLMEFFYVKFGVLQGIKCTDVLNEKGNLKMKCTATDMEEFYKAATEKLRELQKQRTTGDKKLQKAYHGKRTVGAKVDDINRNQFMMKVKPYEGLALDEPPLSVQYLRDKNPSFSMPNVQKFCTKEFAHKSTVTSDYGHFISVESRGYSLHDLLNKYLGITPNELLPFPWEEPNCAAIDVDTMNNITLLQKIETIQILWKEPNLFPSDSDRMYLIEKLEEMIGVNSDGSFILADFGQRINYLNKLKIGPKWVRNELAILYFRSLGRFRNALECIVENLSGGDIEDLPNSDMTLVQLASIIRDSGIANEDDDINLLLKAALLNHQHEHPLTYYLLSEYTVDPDKRVQYLLRSYQLDPSFIQVQKQLYRQYCMSQGLIGPPVSQFFQPVCCWSTEHNIYCFGDPNEEKSCFKINVDTNTTEVKLSSFRCSRKYTARSFAPSPRITLLFGFMYPIAKLRDRKIIDNMHKLLAEEKPRRRVKATTLNALPLDYGGYSVERINKYVNLNTVNVDKLSNKYTNPTVKSAVKAEKKVLKALETIDSVPWNEIVKYDMGLPSPLPIPEGYLKRKGKNLYDSLKLSPLDSCQQSRDAKLLAPYSSDMLITAKGVDLKGFKELYTTSVNGSAEPHCPLASTTSISLFDNMAALKYQEKFNFYKPEKALKDPFLSITKGKDTVQSLATKLSLAMSSKDNKKDLWKLSTIAALYWRLQGDAVNALNCLSYALKYSPKQYRDVTANGLANIYHQAGFLHSALHAADFALKNSETNEVSVHLTIANIYASLRYYDNALQFYYSTLALQSNFVLSRERIRVIQCIKNRKN
ncbi:unnamed protein product [Bursaphelenchus okinawaensis]|uniref:TPR_REGION domain-containing protein n=1 Tax=Bursaphelenchus okinawaensis TaxID=465554 RepID=A0A811L9X1_9BILA|nr:unnamed protein product [Bursaphelenchus okinawaensis]CAG9119556.1 unnamed protein product [Bursaphelenchus okinawaensis]